MAYKSLRMDQISKIIEFYQSNVPKRKIARLLGLSKTTVNKYIDKINSVEDFEQLEPHQQQTKIYGQPIEQDREQVIEKLLPQFNKSLALPGVTRLTLWTEYKTLYPDGFSYGRFCDRIKHFRRRLGATIKMVHDPAYYLMVDFAGKKMNWVDKSTGEVISCEVLVAVLSYSQYTFACAVASQKQEDFIEAINQALLYFGGVPKVLLSDNLKSYVKKADRYEPSFTQLCTQFSTYYQIELAATRVGKPQDKASVERHVAIMYNRLYAPLRNTQFYSLNAINYAFLQQLDKHNAMLFQGKDYSRRDLFLEQEKHLLSPLPNQLFEIKKSTQAKVQRNYHVILGEDKHQYSVPFQYIGKTTKIIYTQSWVEIYCSNQRIASHKRDRRKHGYTSVIDHMPEKHIHHIQQRGWDASYFKAQADKIGPATRWAIDQILSSKRLVEQTYNSCLGVIRLKDKYNKQRLENACVRAQLTHRASYQFINNILKNGTDKLPLVTQPKLFATPDHDNIRGAKNYE